MLNSDLVTYVRELGSLPDGRFSDLEILSFAQNELLTIVKDIISVRQDYLTEQIEIQANAGTFAVRVPARALGGKVRDLVMHTPTPNNQNVNNFISIPRCDISERPDNPIGYFYQGNQIILWNTTVAVNSPSTAVNISYYARPGMLVLTGSCGLITNVSGNVLTVSGANPQSWTSLDIIKGTPGFESIYWGQTMTQLSATSSTSVTVSPTALMGVSGSTIEVGDWICSSNTAPMPQIPYDFHQVLAQRTITKCLESIGDEAGFTRAQAKATEMQRAALDLIAERDDGEMEKLRLDIYSPWVINNRYRGWR